MKPTFLREHALYNHFLHFVVVHEILRQVSQSSTRFKRPAHTKDPQSRCSQFKRIPSPKWSNRPVILGMKYQLNKDVERRGGFQSVPLLSIRVRDGDVWRDSHLRERQVEISRQQVKGLGLHLGGSIRSQSEFHEKTSGSPRSLRLFVERGVNINPLTKPRDHRLCRLWTRPTGQ